MLNIGKIMRKIIITMLLFSVMSAAEPIRFETAVNIALENNLSIKMAENGLQMMANNVNPGVLLPTVSLNGSSNFTDTEKAAGMAVETHRNSASVSTSYTLFSGFYVLNSYKKLKLQYGQTELETRYQVESIITAMAQTFYGLANADEQLQLARENLNISGERLQRVKEREKLGRVNKVEMLAAEVDYNRDSIAVENAKLSVENSRRNLNAMLNREVNSEVSVAGDVNLLTLPVYEELFTSAMKKNADYRAVEMGIDLAEMDVKLAKSRYMPSLNVTGSYGHNQTNNEFDPSLGNPDKAWSVGLSLNFSLFDGFKRKIQTQNAKISMKNQQLQLEQARLNLEKELASQYTTYQNSKKTLAMERMNLAASQANFDRTRELFELGQVTSVQFREAQLNLMRAKSNIAAGEYNVKLNEIALLQLAGMLLD